MNSQPLYIILLISVISFLTPAPAGAIHSQNQEIAQTAGPKKKIEKQEKKMDSLSLIAYIFAMGGLVSLFFVAPVSLFMMPIAFVSGLVAFLGKKRYNKKRGRGLALAAVAIGGAFTLVILFSLLAFALFGF